ncbi:MAG TPA: arginine--tRNA ligase [Thermoanaerobaculia bacterium]|nr:arginine--tRNA ligase [Thermoanaerobaculia bacterium]
MIPGLKRDLESAISEACLRVFGVEAPRVVLETPPKVALGDLACPVAFELAKVLRRPPRKIAEELAPALSLPAAVVRRSVEGSGYVNFHLDRPRVLREMLHAGNAAPAPPPSAEKLIVEHTNINPNKAAHIGHLRNAVLGDVLVATFKRLGRRVEVQNYLDDTGVQVADVVVALQNASDFVEPERAKRLGEEIREILDAYPEHAPGVAPRRLGDLAWDLYGLAGKSYAADPSLEEKRRAALHAIEGAATGQDQSDEGAATAALAGRLAEAVVRCHLLTMERVGVAYDLLPRESDILARRFWVKALELLKAAGAARLETDGRNAGCWVMPLDGAPEFEGMEDADKILVRSNGTVTYTGKDVAYQLWKLGVLGIDFEYEEVPYRDVDGSPEFHASDGVSPLYRTRRDETGSDPSVRGRFGHASHVINVIDVRQSYPQKVVREAVRRAGFPEAADRSVHFAYEMVALTPASAEALGVELTDEDRARPFVEMSGRRGLGVKADDLLDRLVEKANEQILARAGEPPETGRAEAIAVGALRVYMTRFSRNKVIAFDFDEALAFEGDTGPYLQYAAVRAANIFRKLEEMGLQGRLDALEIDGLAALPEGALDDGLWDVVRTCSRTLETLEKVAESLEVSLLVRHALAVAASFHHLYHTHPIAQEKDEATRRARRAALQVVSLHLADLLGVLGVPVPGRM